MSIFNFSSSFNLSDNNAPRSRCSLCFSSLSEGIEERGIIKGREEGRTELLKQQVQKKLAKGQSIEVIAEDLVEDVEVIRTIVDEIQAEE